jgi:hypothetical protein
MSRFALASALFVALAVGTPRTTCLAQFTDPGTRLIRVGVSGGMSVPVNDAKEAFENGFAAQGFVIVRLPAGLPALRASVGLQKMDFKDAEVGGGPSTDLDASSTILSGLASIQLNLMHGPVRPYLLAGLGAFHVKTDVEDESESEVKFGIDGGAGLALRLGRIDAFVEARIQNIYTDEGTADFKNIQVIPLSFGLVF